MLAYGMTKAATHQLATSLAHKDAGLKNATVVCLLPSVGCLRQRLRMGVLAV